jgi:hypothetical protein
LFASFAYLALRRLMPLVLLRFRSSECKERGDRGAPSQPRGHASPVCSSGVAASRPCLPRRREPAAAAQSLAIVLRDARDVARLAPPARCSPLDTSDSQPWSSSNRQGRPRAGPAPGARESAVGGTVGSPASWVGWGSRSQRRACDSSSRKGSGTGRTAGRNRMARVHPQSGPQYDRVRLLHRRDRHAAADLRAVLHRAFNPARSPRRSDRESRRGLDNPAGEELRLVARRARATVSTWSATTTASSRGASTPSSAPRASRPSTRRSRRRRPTRSPRDSSAQSDGSAWTGC